MARISENTVALGLDSRLLELIILPTEKCNFRCTYCYEDFQIGRMKPRTISAVKKLIDSRADDLSVLTLSWFGGEPLLAKNVLFDIATHGFQLSSPETYAFSGGLTTNGYLLDQETLESLHQVNHRFFQITLDGPEDLHNTTRVLANGRPTFDRIWSNLRAIRNTDLDLVVTLRIHVSKSNKQRVPELVKRINEELSDSGKFRIHFHRVSDLGGPGGKSVDELNWSEYGDFVAELTSQSNARATSEYELVEEGSICYAAKPNSLMIRADGRIGKCTVALDDPRNHVGNLNDDGTIEFFNERLRLWFEGYREMDASILGCPLPTLAAELPPPSTARVIDSQLVTA